MRICSLSFCAVCLLLPMVTLGHDSPASGGGGASAVPARVVNRKSKDLGGGFRDHGVAVPLSNHRGWVATLDGEGRNVVLALLMDDRGAYEMLKIDAQTGSSTEHPLPFNNVPDDHTGDSPYASMLSSANKFYSHFGSHFIEFDAAKSAFTFSAKTGPLMSMALMEDDNGVIWSVSYPQCGVVSFDPKTRTFKDYGQVFKQNWQQYPRGLAADDAGWIYIGTGETASQILMFDPTSGKAMPVLADDQRRKSIAHVYRDEDGKVYGQAQRGDKEQWYALHKGEATKVDKAPNKPKAKRYIAGTQELSHNRFPDGGVVEEFSTGDRRLVVRPKGGERKVLAFDYTSQGAVIMGSAAASDGTICGGTSFPMSFFSYDPRADKMSYRPAYMQWNTIARAGDHFFVGGYPGGFLLDWEPGKPWIATKPKNAKSNPRYLTDCTPTIHRPACLVPLNDGKTVIMGGTPEYGHTGGGLLFWDREANQRVLLTDAQVIADQSTQSLIVLPDGKILAGTTTAPGTGGEKKASAAELYVMDVASKKVEWNEVALPGVQGYEGLHLTPDGLVYGIADTKLFFVFDPAKRQVIHKEALDPRLKATVTDQGPRIFVTGPKGDIFVVCRRGIAKVEPKTHTLTTAAEAPIELTSGGDHLDGRLYFNGGSRLYSWEVK